MSETLIARDALREILAEIPAIVEQPPETWWKNTADFYFRTRALLPNLPPETSSYLAVQLHRFRQIIHSRREAVRSSVGPAASCAISEHIIMSLSQQMAQEFQSPAEQIVERRMPLYDLPQRFPDRFHVEDVTVSGHEFARLRVTPPESERDYHLLLPKNERILIKGGPVRGVMDIVFGAPASMTKSEFPPNDIDVIGTGNEERLREVATIMGADPEGVEVFNHPSGSIPFSDYCLGRDTNQNQAYLGSEGLVYSDAARLAAESGHIYIVGNYMPERAIYNVDYLSYNGIRLAKPRGQMRLVKSVSEGKALSYDYIPASNVMDFGVYWLFLARKWSDRENFGDLMQSMFHLGKQMGQVRQGENNVMQVLNRVHSAYPYFDFDTQIKDIEGLVRWKTRKLVKQADREFGWKNRLPAGLDFPDDVSAYVPIKVSLAGYTNSPAEARRIVSAWPEFLIASRDRTAEFAKNDPDVIFRYFVRSDIEDGQILNGENI